MIILKQTDWSEYSIGAFPPNDPNSNWGFSGHDSTTNLPTVQVPPSGPYAKGMRIWMQASGSVLTARKRNELYLANVAALPGGRRFRRSGTPNPFTADGAFPVRGYFVAFAMMVDPASTFFPHTYTGSSNYRQGQSGILYQVHSTEDAGEGGINPIFHMRLNRTPDVPGGQVGRMEYKVAGNDVQFANPSNLLKWSQTQHHTSDVTLGDWIFCIIEQQFNWTQNGGVTKIWQWPYVGGTAPTTASSPDLNFTIANATNDNLGPYPKSGPGTYLSFFQIKDSWYENFTQINWFGPTIYVEYTPGVTGDRDAAMNSVLNFLGAPAPPPPAAWNGTIYIAGADAEGQSFLKSSSTPVSPTVDTETSLSKAEWFFDKDFGQSPDNTDTATPFVFDNAFTPSALAAGAHIVRLRANDAILKSANLNVIDDTGGGPSTALLSTFGEGDGAIINTSAATLSDARNKWRAPAGAAPVVPDINGGKLRFGVLGATVYCHIHDGRPKRFTIQYDWDPSNKDSRLAIMLGFTSQPQVLNFGTNIIYGFGLMLVVNLVTTGAFGPNTHLQRIGMDQDGSGIWDSARVLGRHVYPGSAPDKSHLFTGEITVDFGVGTIRQVLTDTTAASEVYDATFFDVNPFGFTGPVVGLGAKKVQDATAFYITRFRLDVEEYF